MLKQAALCVCLAALAACVSPQDSGVKAIVGGRLESGPSGEAIPYSVIVVANGKIQAAGPQADVPVPKGSEVTRGNGKIIRPVPSSGRIAPGQPADLVIQDAATGHTEKIMHNGAWLNN
jgi:cytosine/adenosine deaminase-related metal-dependent hydrolase